MELDRMKRRLKEYKKEQIGYSMHSEARLFIRSEVTKELIEDNLLSPDKLVVAIEQDAEYEGEEKYRLIFELSKRKNLTIIVILNWNQNRDKIYIPTAYIRYRRLERGLI